MDQGNLCYKDFIYRMRKHAYTSEAYIYLKRVAPKLSQFVRLLSEVKFEDGSYHLYYGEVKKIMTGFLTFYYVAIDDITKDADRLCKMGTIEDITELVEKTVEIHKANYDNFRKDYVVANPAEQKKFKEIEGLYSEFTKKLLKLQVFVKNLLTPEKVQEYAKSQFEMLLEVPREFCEIAFTYLSLMLAEDMDKTRISLLEIYGRLKTNLRIVNEESEKENINMQEQLYDMKKWEMACRAECNRNAKLDLTEAEAAIDTLRIKFERYVEPKHSQTLLEKEVDFWSQKFNDYYKVAENLILLKNEMANVQEKLNNEMTYRVSSSEICCENEQKVYLKEQWEKAARTFLTFYACRGEDHIFYSDKIGKYYMDVYNHKVYVMDHGLANYHMSCADHFIAPPEEKYYYDKLGRYVYHDGRKMYQLAQCSSLMQLDSNELLHKPDHKVLGLTEAEFIDKQTRRTVKDADPVTVLPDINPINVKGTLDKDNATYLWDTFGSILPHALHDVALAKSNNPIHCLAHRLLYYHKPQLTKKELRDRKTEAEAFKANVYKERHEKLLSASKAWKSQQVKRRQPEESDDLQEKVVHDAEMAQTELIKSLNAL